MGAIEVATTVIAAIALLTLVIGIQRYNESKRSRIYTRLDETRDKLVKEMKEDYTQKEIFFMANKQVERRLDAIEKQTALLPDIATHLKTLVGGKL